MVFDSKAKQIRLSDLTRFNRQIQFKNPNLLTYFFSSNEFRKLTIVATNVDTNLLQTLVEGVRLNCSRNMGRVKKCFQLNHLYNLSLITLFAFLISAVSGLKHRLWFIGYTIDVRNPNGPFGKPNKI